jgi:hypothetical protein
VEQVSKKSWSDFLTAAPKPEDGGERRDCAALGKDLEREKGRLDETLAGIEEVLRSDVENLVSAAENLLEACRNCVLLKLFPPS